MAEVTALITAIKALISTLIVPSVLIALWYFRGPITRILHVLPDLLRAAKTLELEASNERVRVFLETRDAPELLNSGPKPEAAKLAQYDPTEQLLQLRDSYRQRLIELTGAEGKGRQASLRKLALLAVDQKKLDPDHADALVQLEGIAQDARFGLIPQANAHAVVTVSGSLLDPPADRPR